MSELSELFDVLYQTQASRYASVACMAWLVHDLIITSALELKHIWQREWSLPKIMFIIVRYYALFYIVFYFAVNTATGIPRSVRQMRLHDVYPIADAMAQVCTASLNITGSGTILVSCITDGLLVLRLHSVYGRRIRVTIPLTFLYFAQLTVSIVIASLSTHQAKVIPPPPILPPLPGCFYDANAHLSVGAWAASLTFASVVFGMTLWKLYELKVEGVEASGILTVFVRDGAMYFGMIFAAEMVCTMAASFGPPALVEIGEPFLVSVLSVSTTRLILNMREYGTSTTYTRSSSSAAPLTVDTGIELQFRRSRIGPADEEIARLSQAD